MALTLYRHTCVRCSFGRPGQTTWTSLATSNLVILPNVLIPGAEYTFTLTLTNSYGAKGFGATNVSVSQPPFGGSFVVSPSNGTTLATLYTFETSGWRDDATSYPLLYRFVYYSVIGKL